MDVDKHVQAEESITLASMDLGRHCTDAAVYKWYVQKNPGRCLPSSCLPWRQEVFFKEDVGTSLKPSCTNYTLRCSIHDHSSETSSLFHPSFPLIHGAHAVLAEPLVLLPSGSGGGQWNEVRLTKQSQKHNSVDNERRKWRKKPCPYVYVMWCASARWGAECSKW